MTRLTYIVRNDRTGKSFEVNTMFEVGLDMVWRSIRNMFSHGAKVTITDQAGNTRSYRLQ